MSSREKAVILVGTSILLLTLIQVYGLDRFLDAAAKRQELLDAERHALARQTELIRGAPAATVEMAAATRVLNDAMPRLFSSPPEEGGSVAALAAVHAYLEGVLTESGATVTRIITRPDSTIRAHDVLTRADLTVAASATLPAFGDLLAALEGGDKLIRITRVRLLGRTTEPGVYGLMSFEVELSAYIFAPQAIDAT